MTHKFSVDQAVMFDPGRGQIIYRSKATVTRLLPFDGTEFQYHITTVDGFERRALESQLQQI